MDKLEDWRLVLWKVKNSSLTLNVIAAVEAIIEPYAVMAEHISEEGEGDLVWSNEDLNSSEASDVHVSQ